MLNNNPIDSSGELKLFRSNIVLVGYILFSLLIGWMSLWYMVTNLNHVNQNIIKFILLTFIVLVCIFYFIKNIRLVFSNQPFLIANPQFLYTDQTGKILWKTVGKIEKEPVRIIGPGAGKTYQIYIHLKEGKKIPLNTFSASIPPERLVDILSTYL